METVAILCVPPAVVGLVGMMRQAGLPASWAPLAAVVVGALLGVLDVVLAGDPVYRGLAGGVLLALAGAGTHDLAGRVGGGAAPRRRAG